MSTSSSTCCQCGEGFEQFAKGSLSISKYSGVKKGNIIPEYKHLDLCPSCSKIFVKLDWKKIKTKGAV